MAVAFDDPGRCVAVYDWDMCTLGDPLADLGTLLSQWIEEGEDQPPVFADWEKLWGVKLEKYHPLKNAEQLTVRADGHHGSAVRRIGARVEQRLKVGAGP